MPKLKLPNKLLLLPNPDKKHNEKWFKGRALGNIPCPFRGIIAEWILVKQQLLKTYYYTLIRCMIDS